jgi:hypothetical protein
MNSFASNGGTLTAVVFAVFLAIVSYSVSLSEAADDSGSSLVLVTGVIP